MVPAVVREVFRKEQAGHDRSEVTLALQTNTELAYAMLVQLMMLTLQCQKMQYTSAQASALQACTLKPYYPVQHTLYFQSLAAVPVKPSLSC